MREAPASMSSRCWLGSCGISGSVIASMPTRIPRPRKTLLQANSIRHAEGDHKFHRAAQFVAVLNKNLQMHRRRLGYWFDLCSDQVGPLTDGIVRQPGFARAYQDRPRWAVRANPCRAKRDLPETLGRKFFKSAKENFLSLRYEILFRPVQVARISDVAQVHEGSRLTEHESYSGRCEEGRACDMRADRKPNRNFCNSLHP